MSSMILRQSHRPWTVFDPTIKAHRQFYADFLKNRTWGNCPVRFYIADDCGDLLLQIHNKLAVYYTQKEFGKIEACAKSKDLVY